MEKRRPLGVTLFVIWSVLIGIVVIPYGVGYVNEGMTGMSDPRNSELLDLWGGYFKTYIWVGALWILTGLGSWLSASALWNEEEWGRKLGIISNLGIILGWVAIKFVSQRFMLPAPIIILLVALPMVYLFTRGVREYCQIHSQSSDG